MFSNNGWSGVPTSWTRSAIPWEWLHRLHQNQQDRRARESSSVESEFPSSPKTDLMPIFIFIIHIEDLLSRFNVRDQATISQTRESMFRKTSFTPIGSVPESFPLELHSLPPPPRSKLNLPNGYPNYAFRNNTKWSV